MKKLNASVLSTCAGLVFLCGALDLAAQKPGEMKPTEVWDPVLNAMVEGPEECKESDKCECPDDDSGDGGGTPADGDPAIRCAQMNVGLGRARYSAITESVVLQLNEMTPTSALYSPAGFRVLAGRAVYRVSREKTAGGVPKWVQISSASGLPSSFLFADNESVGLPVSGQEGRMAERLAMVDAQGWATAADPAYYDYYPGDGSRWRFGAAPSGSDYLQFIEHQTPQGRVERRQDIGLEIIRDAEGVLRQVLTPSRLAHFTVVGQDAYDLAVYPNDASCLSGARVQEGFLEILPGAVPEVVWKFRNPAPGTYGVLDVTREKPGADPATWRYEYVDDVGDFILKSPGGVKEERVERVKSDDGKLSLLRRIKAGPDGVPFWEKEQTYATVAGGVRLTRSAQDPRGLNRVTEYAYHTSGAAAGLQSATFSPDGSWIRYEYDDLRRVTAEIRPWLDAPTNAPDSQCAVTRTSYDLFAPGDFLAYNDQRPRTEIQEICGVEVSRTYHAYPTNALGQAQEIEERAAFPGAPYGHASNPRTVKTYYASTAALPLPGRLATVAYPGGKTETYGYEYGTFNSSTFVFTPDPDGGAWRETVTVTFSTNLLPITAYLLPVPATRSARVWDERGREVLNESYVADGDAFALIGWTRMTYDRNGKLIETAYSDGRVESATWGANCCGKESETAADGTTTVYGYNLLKQKISETKKGLAADGSGDITTFYTYDLENNVLSTAVTNEASGLGYVDTRRAYDAVGRLTNAVDRLGNATVYSYSGTGDRQIAPYGVTNLTERYLDGQTRRVLENGVVKQSYAYGVSPDGARWTLSASGPLPAAITTQLLLPPSSLLLALDFPWQLQITDPLGRTAATHTPGFSHTVLVTSNAYDIAGNLISSSQLLTPNSSLLTAPTLYSYSADGSLYLTALDLNTNNIIDLSGPDRVTGASSAYEKDASNLWWRVSRSWVYPEFNSSSAVTTSVQRVLLTGLGVQRGNEGVLVSYAETLDVRGNATVSETLVDRANRKLTRVTVLPTSVQPEIQITGNGLLASAVSSTAVTNTYGYDALGRQTTLTDGRGNTSITAYNSLGQVAYAEDAATNRTTYSYDTLGRRTSVTDALGNVTRTRYDAEGRVIATWGATYPVAYAYDAQGRMTAMATTRDGTLDFSSITNSSLLLPNSSLEVTRWFYDNPTGLLTNKLYADDLGPSYTYTPAGQLATRTWARLDPDTGSAYQTLYAYDAAGSLLGVDYSDTTPDIAYTYDRLGNMASVADASGIRTFTNDTEGQTLADAVQFQNDVFTLHEAYDAFGRSSGYVLSNTVDGTSSLITGMAQYYDAVSRISEVSVAGVPSPFRYGWLSGSDLQQSFAMPNGVTRQTAYDPHRDLLASIVHTNAAGTVLTRRTFAYDAAGRLTGRTQYRLGDETNRLDAFGYNLRSELTQAVLGTNAYTYVFDPIGNRTTASELGASSVYRANALNQYTLISQSATPPISFSPVFDLDGNQTLLKTTTGIWHVTYNAENRPVVFSNDTTVVEMAYDYMGRRFEYKETVGSSVTRHERYLYRGYLQVAALDLLDATNVIHTVSWDPSESVATRPLALETQSSWFTYAFDHVKNVTELFDASGTLAAVYDYAPFGAVTSATGPSVAVNPLTFSSEVADAALGLQYYNFRHLNTLDGRWMNRDPIEEIVEVNIYRLVNNQPSLQVDHLGLVSFWEWLLEVLGKKKKDEEKKCCTMDPLLASAISALVNDIADAVKNVPNGPSTVAPWIRAANAIKDLACLDASSIEDNCEEFKNDPNFTTCFSCCYVIYQTAGSVEVNAMGWRICEGACSIMFPVGIFE